MLKKSILVLTVLTTVFLFSTSSLMAESGKSTAGKKPQKPFLITSALPHLAVKLMGHLDDPALHLTEEQKGKLLGVRKDVIANVQKIGKQVFPLEKQVAEGIFAGKTPDELRPLVQKIAGLKAEATMVQLQCIYTFSQVLDQQQLEVLKK